MANRLPKAVLIACVWCLLLPSLASPSLASVSSLERNGGNGLWLDPNWTCRGTQAYTTCFSGAVSDQHDACVYVSNSTGNLCSIGWWRVPGWTTPRAFYVTIIDGYYRYYGLGSIQAGSTHYYTTRYMFDVSPGVYRYNFYLDGQLKGERNVHINEGWSYAGCARASTKVSNYGYFWNMQVWAYIGGGQWNWIMYTQPRNWPAEPPDPYYKFFPVGAYPTNREECRKI